jgi:hypothetical protein
MVDDHLRCHHEKDWGEVNAKVKGICEEQSDQKDEMRDLRNSVKHDFQKAEDAADSKFVTKDTFDSVKKLVYGIIALIIAEIIRHVIHEFK